MLAGTVLAITEQHLQALNRTVIKLESVQV